MNVLITVDDSALTVYRVGADGMVSANAVARVPLASAILRGPAPDQWMYDGESWIVGEDAKALGKYGRELNLEVEIQDRTLRSAHSSVEDHIKRLVGGIAMLRRQLPKDLGKTTFAIRLHGDRKGVPFWLAYALRRFRWNGIGWCLEYNESADAHRTLSQGRGYKLADNAGAEVPVQRVLGRKLQNFRQIQQRIAMHTPRATTPAEVVSPDAALPRLHSEDFTTVGESASEDTLKIWYAAELSHAQGNAPSCWTHILSFGKGPSKSESHFAEVVREDTLQNNFRAVTRVDEWGRLTVRVVDLLDRALFLRAVDERRTPVLRGDASLLVQHLTFEEPDEIVKDPDLPEKLDAVAYDGVLVKLAVRSVAALSRREVIETLRQGVQRFVSIKGQPPRMSGAELLSIAANVAELRKINGDPENDAWVMDEVLEDSTGALAEREIAHEKGSPVWQADRPETLLECLVAVTPDELYLLKQDLRLAARGVKK